MTAVTLVAPCDGWLSPLGAVPDPVFSGCLLGDGVAIDPLGDVFHAPAAGEVVALHEAGHAITLRFAPGLEMLIHVGLDTVRLGGRGFTPLVAVGARVAAGDPLLRVALDSVGGQVKSLVTPMILTEVSGFRLDLTEMPRLVRRGDVLATVTGAAAACGA
jgi:phosphocarrier protein FPr/phosphocarrier protein